MIANWEGMLPIDGYVVVVEDDDTLRMLMAEMLTDLGATCCSFSTADDALIHMLSTDKPCALVVSDHGLPGQIDGAEFLDMVGQRWPAVASILTSGYELDAAMVPPNVVYLQKPWSIDMLAAAVSELLQPGTPARRA